MLCGKFDSGSNAVFLGQKPFSIWKKHPDVRSKVGVDLDTFDFLLRLILTPLNAFHRSKVLRKKLLSRENLLALVLNWLREYPSIRSLAVAFSIPSTTIEDYLPRLVDILHEAVRSYVSPPSRVRRKVETGLLTGACLFVDSFPIELVDRPDFHKKESKDRSRYYWYAGSKARKWAIKVQVTLGLDGKVWDTSKAVPYAFSDQQLYRESSVPLVLARDPSLRGIGDSHYSKQAQIIPKVANPKKEADKKRNKAIEGVRSSIEHTVSRLKDWKIMKSQYRGDRANVILVEKFTRIVCGIVNVELENHPIQANLRFLKKSRNPERHKNEIVCVFLLLFYSQINHY